MSKIPRNAQCPCGSGQKYKKCCESKDADAAAERVRAYEVDSARAAAPSPWQVVDDPLDLLSNSVVGLIKEKKFDEALALCERLRLEYPGEHDWLERSAMVHEARGDATLAIDFYNRMLAFTLQPELRDGYDEEVRELFRNKISRLQQSISSPKAS